MGDAARGARGAPPRADRADVPLLAGPPLTGPTATRTLPVAGALALLALALAGCAALRAPAPEEEAAPPLRIGALAEQGDAPRRASTRLLLEGLDADAAGRPQAALSQYERALQVDPTNPYAYLAFARHELDAARPDRALRFLDRAEGLLPEPDAPRVRAHLLGMRGAALRETGRGEAGLALLERARSLAPAVWSDAHLDARELR